MPHRVCAPAHRPAAVGHPAAGLSTTFIPPVGNHHEAPTVLVLLQLARALGVTTAALVAEWEREYVRAAKK
jgi:hypothetical protein